MLKAQDKEVIRALIDVGTGKLAHIYRGECPDVVEGPDTRDSECPACTALLAAQELLKSTEGK